MDLAGKNIVYVGGFGGIGMSSCKILVRKNIASLAILDVVERPDLLAELKQLNPSVDTFSLKLDLCDKQSIEDCLREVVRRTQFIDVLINGSGLAVEKDVELTVNVNLIGLINTNLLAIPLMDKSLAGRGGVIMNISSMLGLEPAPPCAVYSATKHGVIGFTRSLAHEYYYKRTGVAMMMLCPSLTLTPFIDDLEGKSFTFPYSQHVMDTIMGTKSQTADECAQNLVNAVESGKNGAVWTSDAGQLQELQMHTYWQPHC